MIDPTNPCLLYDAYTATVLAGLASEKAVSGAALVKTFCEKAGRAAIDELVIFGARPSDSLGSDCFNLTGIKLPRYVKCLGDLVVRHKFSFFAPGKRDDTFRGFCMGSTRSFGFRKITQEYSSINPSKSSLIVRSAADKGACALLESLMVQHVGQNHQVYYVAKPDSRAIFPRVAEISCNLMKWCKSDIDKKLLLRAITGMDLSELDYFFGDMAEMPSDLGSLAYYVMRELPLVYHSSVLDAIQNTELLFGNLFDKSAENALLHKLKAGQLSIQVEDLSDAASLGSEGLNAFKLVSLLAELFPRPIGDLIIAFDMRESSGVTNEFLQNKVMGEFVHWLVQVDSFDTLSSRFDLTYSAEVVYAFKQPAAFGSLCLLETDEYVVLNGFNMAGPDFPGVKSKIIKAPKFFD